MNYAQIKTMGEGVCMKNQLVVFIAFSVLCMAMIGCKSSPNSTGANAFEGTWKMADGYVIAITGTSASAVDEIGDFAKGTIAVTGNAAKVTITDIIDETGTLASAPEGIEVVEMKLEGGALIVAFEGSDYTFTKL
jgi:hypothetical protein